MEDRLFQTFAFCPQFDKKIELLASLVPEKWSFAGKNDNAILKNYIVHTFGKLKDECDAETDPERKKDIILEAVNYSCFNTGLFTDADEPVFAYFEKNQIPDRQPWCLKGFVTEYQLTLYGVSRIPRRANYFFNPADLVFDTNLKIVPQYKHIFGDRDNFLRIPEQVRESAICQTIFDGAIKLAQKKIEANYKTAIPQYYKGKIQLLIPLCLIDRQNASLALVVTKNEQANCYQGHTCLQLDMAYNNARLIARPNSEWLHP